MIRHRHTVVSPVASFVASFVASLMLLGLSACSTSPVVHYYTLNATPTAENHRASTPTNAAAATSAVYGGAYSVSVAAITVPEAVDRPQLVVQLNANRVDILENQRWADTLKREIPRVVAEDLAQRLTPARVAAYPQHAAEDPSYTVFLDVQRFDSVPGTAATLDVIWTLRRESDATLRTHRSVLRETSAGSSFDTLVAAHSRALAALSDEIAQAIRADFSPH